MTKKKKIIILIAFVSLVLAFILASLLSNSIPASDSIDYSIYQNDGNISGYSDDGTMFDSSLNADYIDVLSAASELNPGAVVQEGDIVWTSYPIDAVPNEALTRDTSYMPSDFLGQVVREYISSGGVVRSQSFFNVNSSDLSATLLPNMTVYLLQGNISNLYLQGRLTPGDFIDLSVSFNSNAKKILGNVRVVSVGPFFSAPEDVIDGVDSEYYAVLMSDPVGRIGLYVTEEQHVFLSALFSDLDFNNISVSIVSNLESSLMDVPISYVGSISAKSQKENVNNALKRIPVTTALQKKYYIDK